MWEGLLDCQLIQEVPCHCGLYYSLEVDLCYVRRIANHESKSKDSTQFSSMVLASVLAVKSL